jgi:dTDP-glucose pyrophosphorylase
LRAPLAERLANSACQRVRFEPDVIAVEEGVFRRRRRAALRDQDARQTDPVNPDQKVGIDIVRKALQWPARQIAENSGTDGSIILASLLESQDAIFRGDTGKHRFDLSIEVAIEPHSAGTGGALSHARDRLDESFYLLNGDSWFDIPLNVVGERLLSDVSAIAAVALREAADASRYGTVTLERDRITEFAERPAQRGPGLISGGVYAFRRSLLDHLRDRCSPEHDHCRRSPRPARCSA